jgi:hypothetical protein
MRMNNISSEQSPMPMKKIKSTFTLFAVCLWLIGFAPLVATPQASAQSWSIPTWEEVGLWYSYYINGYYYTLGTPISPTDLYWTIFSYGNNPASAAYWWRTAQATSDIYYNYGFNQSNYYNWYAAYDASINWQQGPDACLAIYEGWVSYGDGVADWFYQAGEEQFEYYIGLADYYSNLINPDLEWPPY